MLSFLVRKVNAYWLILILAIVLRLILSAISFHPDVQASNLGRWIIVHEHIANIYDYVPALPKDNPLLSTYPVDYLIYPPAVYFFQAFFGFLFNGIAGLNSENYFLVNIPQYLGNLNFNLQLLTLKIPYILFDILIAFLIYRILDNEKEKKLAAFLWLVNPVAIYSTYLIGQFDVIPTFFVVLAVYLLRKEEKTEKNNLYLSAIILGLGAVFKIYPLFLLIPLTSLVTSWKMRFKLVLLGLLPYLLTVLPFIGSAGFRSSALLAPHTVKSFYAQIMISGGEGIILFLLAIGFMYLLFLSANFPKIQFWKKSLIILLLFFIFTHYHPQWFTWLSPWLILAGVQSKGKLWLPIILTLISFTGLLFFFDPSLTLGLFSPIIPKLYTVPSLWQLLGLNMDYTFGRSILQTLFVSSAIFIMYYYYRESNCLKDV